MKERWRGDMEYERVVGRNGEEELWGDEGDVRNGGVVG